MRQRHPAHLAAGAGGVMQQCGIAGIALHCRHPSRHRQPLRAISASHIQSDACRAHAVWTTSRSPGIRVLDRDKLLHLLARPPRPRQPRRHGSAPARSSPVQHRAIAARPRRQAIAPQASPHRDVAGCHRSQPACRRGQSRARQDRRQCATPAPHSPTSVRTCQMPPRFSRNAGLAPKLAAL